MGPERWCEIERVYHLARELPPVQREAFLEETCGGDEELRLEVKSLLNQGEEAEEYVRAAALAAKAQTLELRDLPGETVGRYRLLQKIGEGGMGEVWLAAQEEPVRRRVALKLIKAGMNSREVIARFESERQALALMDHPAIAKVFDAGSTHRGAPYFVMEYVAGVPITTYCDDSRLTVRERLELFMRVCEGVQHAHQKAIIHRDLKPANILVTEVDGKSAPRIIDFGIAKALTQKQAQDTVLTRLGAPMGTLEYMSPEQALSSGEDIDTRTDVYSLGVIFYELLAGVPPLDLRKIAFDEYLRRLRDDEPAKPSARIRTRDQSGAIEVARRRRTEPLALTKEIHGDLDSIALKALEKDRLLRYGSPSDFAADIGLYLNHEAVGAVPPSAAYRARKFTRRHRVAMATVAAFVMVLMLATGISIRQTVRATKQRERADAEAAVAQAVNDFLQNDLLAQASAVTQSGPGKKPDLHLEVRTALDRAATRIAGKFNRQPQVEAAIRDTIGHTYLDLGLYPEARTQLERALELNKRASGPDDPRTLKTATRLGQLAVLEGKYPQAEALLSGTVKTQRRVLGAERRDTLSSAYSLATVYYWQGKYSQTEALLSQTLEIQRRVLGPEDPETLLSINLLAAAHIGLREYAEAEALYSRLLEIQRRVLGPEHPSTLFSMVNLANIYFFQGKYAQAEVLYRENLEVRRRVLGPEHPDTLISLNNLAASYENQGKYEQAQALYSQNLEIQRRISGPEHPFTLVSLNNLAEVYEDQGKYTEAEALYRKTLEIRRRVLGPEHPGTLETLSYLAALYQDEGKYALAETYAVQALKGRRHTLGSEQADTADAAADLAMAYQSQGKFVESEPLAREAFEFDSKKRPDDYERFRAESLLGASLAGQKKYAEAEPVLLDGYRGILARKDRIPVSERNHLDRVRVWVVHLYKAWGKPAKAAEFGQPLQ